MCIDDSGFSRQRVFPFIKAEFYYSLIRRNGSIPSNNAWVGLACHMKGGERSENDCPKVKCSIRYGSVMIIVSFTLVRVSRVLGIW